MTISGKLFIRILFIFHTQYLNLSKSEKNVPTLPLLCLRSDNSVDMAYTESMEAYVTLHDSSVHTLNVLQTYHNSNISLVQVERNLDVFIYLYYWCFVQYSRIFHSNNGGRLHAE